MNIKKIVLPISLLYLMINGCSKGDEASPSRRGGSIVGEKNISSRQIFIDFDDSKWKSESLACKDRSPIVGVRLGNKLNSKEVSYYSKRWMKYEDRQALWWIVNQVLAPGMTRQEVSSLMGYGEKARNVGSLKYINAYGYAKCRDDGYYTSDEKSILDAVAYSQQYCFVAEYDSNDVLIGWHQPTPD